jgi:RimJ/RimL family protein N-acetyltransferase
MDLAARTGRLRLQLIAQADADELHRILDDPELHRFTGGQPFQLGELRQRIAKWQLLRSPDGEEIWLNWIVRLAATRAVVGYVQASVKEGTASIAYVIGRAYWGQGLASEATLAMCRILHERLAVEELVAHIHPLHEASQRVARRAGLTRTADTDAEGEEIWKLRLSDPT